MCAVPLLLAVAVAAQPSRADLEVAAAAFASAHPGARVALALGGGLAQASGLAVARAAADDELNARLFLAREGRPFGIGSDDDLQTRAITSYPGSDGVARFRRLVAACPCSAATSSSRGGRTAPSRW